MSANTYFHAEHERAKIKAELHERPEYQISAYVALTVETDGAQVCLFLTPEQADEVAHAIVNR